MNVLRLFVLLGVMVGIYGCEGEHKSLPHSAKVILHLDDDVCSVDQWVYCWGYKGWISGNETAILDSAFVRKGQHRVELDLDIPIAEDFELLFARRGPMALVVVPELGDTLELEISDDDLLTTKAIRGKSHNEYYEYVTRDADYKLRLAAMDGEAASDEAKKQLREEWFRFLVKTLGSTDNSAVANGGVAGLRVHFPDRLKELDTLMQMVAKKYADNKSLSRYAGITSSRREDFLPALPASAEGLMAEKRVMEIMQQRNKIELRDVSIGSPFVASFRDSIGHKVVPCVGDGGYALVDFWASWCKPCRREVPFLKQALEKYGNRFTVLAVSIDSNSFAWKKAIQEDGSQNFVHARGVYSNGSPLRVVKELDIRTIPRNFLIDDRQRIVAKDLRGEELMQVLDSLLSK